MSAEADIEGKQTQIFDKLAGHKPNSLGLFSNFSDKTDLSLIIWRSINS